MRDALAQPEQITPGIGDEQLLYFTTSSLDAEDRHLWFVRERDGSPNIHRLDLETGAETQLTDNGHGRLWQYVSFGGERGRGLGVWSVALDADRGVLYYLQDQRVWRAEPAGGRRCLADLPADETTGFIDVSDCGRWLCVPTTDDRALGSPTPDGRPLGGHSAIDARCQELGLCSYLRVFDTETGAEADRVCVPRCWITHVQFRPGEPEHILYNHEWPSLVGVRRMWLWDGRTHHCLRPAGEGREPGDWVCHEVWALNGECVVYHGGFQNGPSLIGRWDAATHRLRELPLPEGWKRYGHFQVDPCRDGLLVCDGYYETAADEPGQGRWISLLDVDWDAGTIEWTPLCRHRSGWRCQDDHPHPILDHAAGHVYFTGGTRSGRRAVFRTPLP